MNIVLILATFVIGFGLGYFTHLAKKWFFKGKSYHLPEGYSRLSVNIPSQVHTELKQLAQASGRTMTSIVTQVLSFYLAASFKANGVRRPANNPIETSE
jgi:hypothetical protein